MLLLLYLKCSELIFIDNTISTKYIDLLSYIATPLDKPLMRPYISVIYYFPILEFTTHDAYRFVFADQLSCNAGCWISFKFIGGW
jgi:hypothetical protein